MSLEHCNAPYFFFSSQQGSDTGTISVLSVICAQRTILECSNAFFFPSFFVLAASSMVISGLSVFFLWFVHKRWQNILMSCIFGAVSTIGFNSLDVLQTELFPTDVR